MDKKTLVQLIHSNINEIESLIKTISNDYAIPAAETNILQSKLKVLLEEIDLLDSLSDVAETEELKDHKIKEKVEKVVKEEEAIKQTEPEPVKETAKTEKKPETDTAPKKESQKSAKKEKPEKATPKKDTKKEEKADSPDRTAPEASAQAQVSSDKNAARSEKTTEKQEDLKTTQTTHEKIQEKGRKGIMADQFEVTKQSLNDILANAKKTKDIASILKDKPIADLTKAISINDKIRFTKELFDGKNDLYLESIKTLNECNDLDDALRYLNDNFTWDQDKESFREFLELIYRRFVNA